MVWLLSISVAVLVFLSTYLLLYDLGRSKLNLEKRLRYIEEIDSTGRRKKKKKGEKSEKMFLFRFLKISRDFRENILLADISLKPEEFILFWFVGAFVCAIVAFTFTTSILSTGIVALITAFIPPFYIKMRIAKRRQLFQIQLGDALMILSNALRTGFSFTQALASVSKSLADPIGREFSTVTKELQLGVDVEEALLKVSDRMNNSDLKLLSTAVIVQQQVGGNLSEILDTLALTIRNRMAVARTVRTLTAQGRMSGMVIGCLPIVFLVVISIIAPGYILPLVGTLLGRVLLVIGAVMQLFGFFVISRIVDIKL